MNKPSKPSAPVEPKTPVREWDEGYEQSHSFSDNSVSLNAILTKVNQLVATPVVGKIEGDSFEIGIDSGEEYRCVVLNWYVTTRFVLSDGDWFLAQQKHKAQREAYLLKLERYSQLSEQYEADLKEYEAWRQSEEVRRDLATLAKLKEMYPTML